MDGIQRNSPKSAMVSQNVLSGGNGSPNGSDSGTFDAPSLANAVGSSQPKPGSFAAKMAAAKQGGASAGGSAFGGGGGLFKKY